MKRKPIHQGSLEALKACISTGHTYLTKSSTLVFTCGKTPNNKRPGGRDLLMTYADKHLKTYNFFIAEHFFQVFENKGGKDLLSLEDQLAKFCDCIIVVLESEGAFSELGAFTIKDDLAKMMLIINDRKFIHSKSFISQGPIAKIDRVSKFKPTIYASISSILTAIPAIVERLKRISKQTNTRLSVQNFNAFRALAPKHKMLFILDLISILHPVNRQELIYTLKYIYGDNSYDISVELGLLMAMRLIQSIDGYYVRISGDFGRFIRFKSINETLVRSNIVNHYHKYFSDRCLILRKKIGY
jgi:hypothetical protein